MNVGFIGLGRMGAGMARNLVKAGHHVTVFNRSPAKAEALIREGAQAAARIAEACRGDAVVTMLANDEAVESLVLGRDGVVANLPPGALHVSSSTISVALSQRLADAHGKGGQQFIAAPVFGRPDVAAAGRLFVVVGGDPAAVEAATPLLETFGQENIRRLGYAEGRQSREAQRQLPDRLGDRIPRRGPGAGRQGGRDRRRYLEVLTSTLFDAPIYRTYGGLIAGGKFEPAGFAAPLGQKDIRLALAAAEELRVPMPLASLLRDRFLTLLAQGGDQLDWSAIGGLAARDAGIRPV